MAIAQLDYTSAPPKGLHGQISSEEKSNRISRTIKTPGGLAFGVPVQRGEDEHTVVAAVEGGTVLGITILTPAVPPVAVGSTLVDGYPFDYTAGIMTMGAMKVRLSGDVTQGDPVYYEAFGETEDAPELPAFNGTEGLLIPNAVFEQSGVEGDIVEFTLRLRPEAAPAAATGG